MNLLAALAAEIGKMFVADLWLTLTALAVVGFAALALHARLAPPAALPFLVAGGVLAALVIGVVRGARAANRGGSP
ncbi:MAG: hypothetical protein JOZ27_00015 [Caulobacteraceae bacterium]|nr:hypothetical protein [Caulobacteraceae bacterium]